MDSDKPLTKIVKDTYEAIKTLNDSELLEKSAIFFGLSDKAIDFQDKNGVQIKDFESRPEEIELRHPICFQCFEEIIMML